VIVATPQSSGAFPVDRLPPLSIAFRHLFQKVVR
jgi:hypothetical protein